MAKKKHKTQKQNIAIPSELNQRKEVYDIQNMDRNIRDRDTFYIFKVIKNGIAIFFSISLGFIAILSYINNISVPSEIVFGLPTSAILTIEIPKNILAIFKKPPP